MEINRRRHFLPSPDPAESPVGVAEGQDPKIASSGARDVLSKDLHGGGGKLDDAPRGRRAVAACLAGFLREVHGHRKAGEIGETVNAVTDGENARIVGVAFVCKDIEGPGGAGCDRVGGGAMALELDLGRILDRPGSLSKVRAKLFGG